MAFERDNHRTTGSQWKEPSATGVYGTEDSERGNKAWTNRGDSADEVDPRRLVSDPTINELRWYYRRTDVAPVIVDKPIDDAFKYGFEVDGDNGNVGPFLKDSGYVDAYKLAQKKARRDGFALIFANLRDTSDGPHEVPQDVVDVSGFRVLTIDNLTTGSRQNVAEKLGYDHTDIEVRPTGIVISVKSGDPRYRKPVGYVVDEGKSSETKVVHHSRVQHLTWNRQVDMNLRTDTLGEYEGDSILVRSYDVLKGLKKGNWSIMQALYRYAAKMYAVKVPNDANEEEFNEVDENIRNLNSKSEVILPSQDYEMEDFDSDGQLDPSPYYEVIFDQLCAGHEMTKSVLFGTQAGVVTGSEVDIKNYFNKVERFRTGRAEDDFDEMVEMVNSYNWSSSASRPFSNADLGFEIDWSPMFKVSDLDRAEIWRTKMNTLQMALNDFVLTQDEARAILKEDWAEIDDADVELNPLDDDDIEQMKQIAEIDHGFPSFDDGEGEAQGNPQKQARGGGMPEGNQSASENPSQDTDNVDIVET